MNEETLSRLNKHLALNLGVSRREADNLISQGRVKINGQVAILGARVSQNDKLSVDGKNLGQQTKYQCVILNKPRGYVCSRKQQGSNKTIYDLLPKSLHHLKPVGRLDKDSSGLILLSNDGDFAYRMTHPSFQKVKIYKAQIDKDLEPLHQQMISDYGISLDDGVSKMQLERLSENERKSWLITMKEGRNRQIRRTFAALGYEVIKLHRINFGNYALNDLESGEYQSVEIH